MDKYVTGHSAEMRALREFESSAEARYLSRKFAARDLRAAAEEISAMVEGRWVTPEPDLFGEVTTQEQAFASALDDVERCIRVIRSAG